MTFQGYFFLHQWVVFNTRGKETYEYLTWRILGRRWFFSPVSAFIKGCLLCWKAQSCCQNKMKHSLQGGQYGVQGRAYAHNSSYSWSEDKVWKAVPQMLQLKWEIKRSHADIYIYTHTFSNISAFGRLTCDFWMLWAGNVNKAAFHCQLFNVTSTEARTGMERFPFLTACPNLWLEHQLCAPFLAQCEQK